jgi:hypothetical protein
MDEAQFKVLFLRLLKRLNTNHPATLRAGLRAVARLLRGLSEAGLDEGAAVFDGMASLSQADMAAEIASEEMFVGV